MVSFLNATAKFGSVTTVALSRNQKTKTKQTLTLWYYYTTGLFAFYINATSTPRLKNGIRPHSRAFADIGRHSRALLRPR
jgi:hypothetical protein